MQRKTKADLERELMLLEQYVGGHTSIDNCTFHGGVNKQTARAVVSLAQAITQCAIALQGPTGLTIKNGGRPRLDDEA